MRQQVTTVRNRWTNETSTVSSAKTATQTYCARTTLRWQSAGPANDLKWWQQFVISGLMRNLSSNRNTAAG